MSARPAPTTASAAPSSATWSRASPRASSRSSRSTASASAPPPQGQNDRPRHRATAKPVDVEAPAGIKVEVPTPDAHHHQRRGQAGGRPARRLDPQAPPARAVQGQGRALQRRSTSPQGRQDRQVTREQDGEGHVISFTVKDKRNARTPPPHCRVRKKMRGTAQRPRLGRVPLQPPHHGPGDRRPHRRSPSPPLPRAYEATLRAGGTGNVAAATQGWRACRRAGPRTPASPRSKTTLSTPAALARSATSWPTLVAASTLPCRWRRSRSGDEAEASVRPVRSSITWALMWRFERNTARRGRSAVPAHLLAHPAVAADAGVPLLLALCS